MVPSSEKLLAHGGKKACPGEKVVPARGALQLWGEAGTLLLGVLLSSRKPSNYTLPQEAPRRVGIWALPLGAPGRWKKCAVLSPWVAARTTGRPHWPPSLSREAALPIAPLVKCGVRPIR